MTRYRDGLTGRPVPRTVRVGMACAGWALAFAVMMPAARAFAGSKNGQAAAVKSRIDDTWQGTLHAGKDLRVVLKIAKEADGALKATFYSIDHLGVVFP